MYAGLGFIFGLASIFSAQLLVFDFYMHTIKCDYSGKNLLNILVGHNLSWYIDFVPQNLERCIKIRVVTFNSAVKFYYRYGLGPTNLATE